MAWNINRVVLVGRLATDVDLRYTPSGTAVAKFRLAVGGKPKPDGSDNASFLDIVVRNKAGENCSHYLSKGKMCCVDGYLQQSNWKAQDGSNRSRIEIVAERVEFLSPVSGGGNASGGTNAGGGAPRGERQTPPTGKREDDIPMDNDFYDNTGFDDRPVDPNMDEPGY